MQTRRNVPEHYHPRRRATRRHDAKTCHYSSQGRNTAHSRRRAKIPLPERGKRVCGHASQSCIRPEVGGKGWVSKWSAVHGFAVGKRHKSRTSRQWIASATISSLAPGGPSKRKLNGGLLTQRQGSEGLGHTSNGPVLSLPLFSLTLRFSRGGGKFGYLFLYQTP